MLSATFIVSAIRHLSDWQAGLNEIQQLAMPRSSALLFGSIMLRLTGGILVLLGYRAKIGGLLLACFVLPAAVLAHGFWMFPAERQLHESIEFLNDLSMAGGAILIAAVGSGGWSLDQEHAADHQTMSAPRENSLSSTEIP
jgi:putative oxidoreductase